jgi:hypothetical protein
MQSMNRRFINLFLVLVGFACSFAVQAAYVFTTVDYPGAVSTSLWGINDSGQAVGGATFSNGSQTNFIYDVSKGTFAPVSAPVGTGLLGINASGVLAGGLATGGIESGIILNKKGSPTTFSHPGFDSTQARAIGKSGLVTGFSINLDNNPDPCLQEIEGSVGFIYDPASGNFTDILPSPITIAQGINGRGQVVGSVFLEGLAAPAGDGLYGFLRDTNGAITLFRVNNRNTRARGITDSGLITGFVNNPGGPKGFVASLSAAPGYQSLSIPPADLLSPANPNVGTFGQGINNAGVVSGAWTDVTTIPGECGDQNVSHGFIATPLPPKKK